MNEVQIHQHLSRRIGAHFATAAVSGFGIKGAPLHSHPKSGEPGEVAFERMVTALERMPDAVVQRAEAVPSKAYKPAHGGCPG